ncbi:hypothetical protein [Paenibacillus sp. GCM10027629]|uniref:hypothetical protein n=1 Tax=Paenibacillus sp. GCM10027629 TaxID=3273414 RepID=UPI0036D36D80
MILFDSSLSGWKPTNEDISNFESGIREYLVELMDKGGISYESQNLKFVIDNFKDYKRQYFGLSNTGNKVIYCNFLLVNEEYEFDWKNKYITVNDGGPSFLSIKFNKSKKKYFDLSINGNA